MNVLIVDDDRVTRELVREIVEREGFSTETAASGEDAIRLLKTKPFPLIISDIRMQDASGLDVLAFVKSSGLSSVVILMTGFGTMDGAIAAIQEGAFDYISKPFKIEELKSLVRRARDHWQSIYGNQNPQPAPTGKTPGFSANTLIGKSPQIVEVYRTLARATLSPSNVLIIGESGTGKELVARGIHDNSPRARFPFIAVNCGALAETLLESELFGHLKGSFTGAIANKSGLFEEAHQGTLFLDEIGDIPAPLQVKLLRVIQEGEVKPVGATDMRKVDVRVIAATHIDLESRVADGRFREDLYYRLKVIRIDLPPLRDRLEDLPELILHFLGKYSEKIGKKISQVSDESMQLLRAYPWPGNIRELEHAIEHAITMTRTTVLYPEDFPSEIGQAGLSAPAPASVEGPVAGASLDEMERKHIMRVLEEVNFNKSRAASILGIDRKTLHRKAKRYQIKLPD